MIPLIKYILNDVLLVKKGDHGMIGWLMKYILQSLLILLNIDILEEFIWKLHKTKAV